MLALSFYKANVPTVEQYQYLLNIGRYASAYASKAYHQMNYKVIKKFVYQNKYLYQNKYSYS